MLPVSFRAVGAAMAVAGVVCFSLRPIPIKLAYGKFLLHRAVFSAAAR